MTIIHMRNVPGYGELRALSFPVNGFLMVRFFWLGFGAGRVDMRAAFCFFMVLMASSRAWMAQTMALFSGSL